MLKFLYFYFTARQVETVICQLDMAAIIIQNKVWELYKSQGNHICVSTLCSSLALRPALRKWIFLSSSFTDGETFYAYPTGYFFFFAPALFLLL